MENGTFSRHDTKCQGGCSFRSHSGIFQLIVPIAALQDDYKQINYSIRSEATMSCRGTVSTLYKFIIFYRICCIPFVNKKNNQLF